jgi:hypothetical protein
LVKGVGEAMGWQQIAILILICMESGATLVKHGEKREGEYNFFTSLISSAILLFLLIGGGFFG